MANGQVVFEKTIISALTDIKKGITKLESVSGCDAIIKKWILKDKGALAEHVGGELSTLFEEIPLEIDVPLGRKIHTSSISTVAAFKAEVLKIVETETGIKFTDSVDARFKLTQALCQGAKAINEFADDF